MDFKQQLDQDINDVFLSPDDFGQVVTYYPKTGNSYEVRCIFQEAFQDVNLGGDIDVSSTHPCAWVRQSSIIDKPHKGDEIEINGIRYKIRDPQEDGIGMIMLALTVKNV